MLKPLPKGMFVLAIRNSAKALVLRDGKILLNRCISRMGVYYALPGGGQHDGELLTEAVKREVLEETGLSVEPTKMSAVFERVTEGRDGQNCTHKMYFVFMCKYLEKVPIKEPIERDAYQTGTEWIKISDVQNIGLFPKVIRDNLTAMINCKETLYLGSERR